MGKRKNKKRSNIYRKTKNKVEVLNLYESPSYEKEENKEVEDSIIEIEDNKDNNYKKEDKVLQNINDNEKIEISQEEQKEEKQEEVDKTEEKEPQEEEKQEEVDETEEKEPQEEDKHEKIEFTHEKKKATIQNNKDTSEKNVLLKRNISIADGLKVIVLVFFGILIVTLCIKYFSTNFSSNNNTSNSNNNESIEYKIVNYNNNDYEYKILKNTSVLDNITLIDKESKKEIQYAFKISGGKVIVNNSKNEYTIKGIKNAERLTIATASNVTEYSSVFVITSDGKVYSISLYDNKYNLIKDNKKFEQTISSYKFDSKIVDMSFGVYTEKNKLDEKNIILLTDDKGKQHVLTK